MAINYDPTWKDGKPQYKARYSENQHRMIYAYPAAPIPLSQRLFKGLKLIFWVGVFIVASFALVFGVFR